MILTPSTEAEAAEAVRTARADGQKLRIQGGGTRGGLGRPVRADATLSSAGLTGVTAYEPAELVISARAGTPLSHIESEIAAKGQMLPFEPMDHRAIYATQGEPTIGAIAACNISGPRRIRVGAARDSLLGLRLVNGFGDVVKTGGRVMKNVTGLDLVKLNCGAHGALGFITEVTFKLLPRPECAGSLVIDGLDDDTAIAALSAALGAPFEVSGAAHLPGEAPRTLVRIEHFRTSVEYRMGELETLLRRFGPVRRLEENDAATLWRDIRDGQALGCAPDDALWRVSLAPSRAAGFVAGLGAQGLAKAHFYDWGGGLVWLASDVAALAGGEVHKAAAAAGGHATLIRAPDDLRGALDVFQPQPAPLMALTARLKASFDPDRTLNPGRMYDGV